MKLHRRQVLTLAAMALPLHGQAQSKPIRLIVPYPPGGPLDIVARALADKVKDSLGTVVVENRPGAGGNLGMDLVAKSAPDGLTLGMGAVATHAINPWLYAKIPYDPIRDFTPITLVAQVPNVLVMNVDTAKKLGIHSVADLVRLLGLEGQACAVEVNKLLVPRRRHAEQGLKTGDVVELVTLVGGG